MARENPVPAAATRNRTRSRKAKATDDVASLALSHPDKVYFPEAGITKHELAQHYIEIAWWLLPHIEHRPLSLFRCPDGWSGQCFFQKHADSSVHGSVDRVEVPESKGTATYYEANSPAALAALVQWDVIELHPWGARAPRLDRPDRLIFDLDPERPLDPDVLVTELLPVPQSRIRLRWRVLAILFLVVLIAGLAFAWRETALGSSFDIEAIFDRISSTRSEAWIQLAIPAVFVLAGFALVPLTLLIALTVAVYGGLHGGALAFAGAMASAAAGYALGRGLGRDVVRRYAGRRLNALSSRLAKRGLLAVLLVRLLPIAPFAVVNVVGGATHLGWRDFLMGTALGLLPGLVMTAAFIDRAIAAVRTPDPASIALLALWLLVIAISIVAVQRKLHLDAARDQSGRSAAVPG